MRKDHILMLFVIITLLVCCRPEQASPGKASEKKTENILRISFDGKKREHPIQKKIYHPIRFDSIPLPFITPTVIKALKRQMQLLDYSNTHKYRLASGRIVNKVALMETVYLLQRWQHTYPFGLNKELKLYRLQGEDQRTNVKFTGYYSPVVNISQEPTPTFRYPIYKRPRHWEGPLPSRRAIEAEGALDTLDVIIGWSNNKFDIYRMQIQGSGYVRYPGGNISFFTYDGTNQHPYRSMEKFLRAWDGPKPMLYSLKGIQSFFKDHPELVDTVLYQNPSYTFFRPSRGLPVGAGAVPLTAEMSVAVDQRYIPLGACLLAAVPIYDDQKKRVTHHEYRFLFAQDVGGMIKGPGHVDLYLGAGNEAQQKASSLRHYGQLYLILPKEW